MGPAASAAPPKKKSFGDGIPDADEDSTSSSATRGGCSSSNASQRGEARGSRAVGDEGPVCSKPWGTEKLQKYLCYVKDTFTSVRLTRDAEVNVENER